MHVSRISVIGLHLSEETGERIQNLVGKAGLGLELTDIRANFKEFERAVAQNNPDLLLMEYKADQAGYDELIQRLRHSKPNAGILAVSHCRDADEILRVMRMGVSEFLLEPYTSQDFSDAITRIRPHHRLKEEPGAVISFMSAKGGMGASQLALNLAWALNGRLKKDLALVDLNIQGGDLASLLDVQPEQNLGHVAKHYDRFSYMSEGFLTEIGEGYHLLAAPEDILAGDEVGPTQVSTVLDTLEGMKSLVLLDLPSRQFNEASITALDRSKYIFLVTEPSMPGVSAALHTLKLLDRLEYGPNKIRVIINRAGSRFDLSLKKVEKALDTAVYGWIPNDSKVVNKATRAGRPVGEVAKRSPFAKAVYQLAVRLMAENEKVD